MILSLEVGRHAQPLVTDSTPGGFLPAGALLSLPNPRALSRMACVSSTDSGFSSTFMMMSARQSRRSCVSVGSTPLQAHLATLPFPAMCVHVRPRMHTVAHHAAIILSYTPSGHSVRRSPSAFLSFPVISFLQAAISALAHSATDLGHLSAVVAARPHRPSSPPPNTPAAAQHCLM